MALPPVEFLADAAMRLDVALARASGLTRSRVERLIREGNAAVEGERVAKPGHALRAGQRVTLRVPEAKPLSLTPEDLPIEVLYEDGDLAVVNKPCGMVVHPAAGNETGTLVHALLHRLTGLSGIGGAARPGIVHRLDKDTSGLLLIAKHDRAHVLLSAMLKERRIEKIYQAVALGGFREPEGLVDAPIARDPKDRKRMAVAPGGRPSQTAFCAVTPLRGATLLQVRLLTGRTHQIRVHMAHIGHPLLGDPVYGGKRNRALAPRLMLHAWRLSLAHPITGEALFFEAPPPPDFSAVVRSLSVTPTALA